MFQSQQKYTGTEYTPTVTLLLAAFVVAPLILFFSRPISLMSVLMACVFSGMCLMAARVTWKHANLTIPSIESPVTPSK